MNRSYSLIETPEQEAIARLLTNGKIPERYLAWNKKRGFYPMTLPGSKMTQVPFDELVQIIGADGVQAVRALAGMVTCKCDDCQKGIKRIGNYNQSRSIHG